MSKSPKTSASDKAKFDKLAELLRGTSPEKLKTLLVKSKMITLRVTESDQASMAHTAKSCGLTLTEYLTRLHYFVCAKLEGEK